jgi:hypothetical protein
MRELHPNEPPYRNHHINGERHLTPDKGSQHNSTKAQILLELKAAALL